jgi:fatty-acyl-CoA synthase
MQDWLAAHAQLQPQAEALWFNQRWYTYLELHQRANRMANRLHGLGIGVGDKVGILSLNHIAHIELWLAAFRLGCIMVPFNFRLSHSEQRQLADLTQPQLMFCDSRHEHLIKDWGLPWTRLSDYREWLNVGSVEAAYPAFQAQPDDIHLILFTGGSTGLPKGACLPYRQTFGNLQATVQDWQLKASDSTIQATACFHAGLNALAMPLLFVGGRVLLQTRFDVSEYLDLIKYHRVSHLFMVPSMYLMLTQHEEFERAEFQSVSWMISGGAPCPVSLREVFWDKKKLVLRQGYGMTEAGVNCFTMNEDTARKKPSSVGKPIVGMQAVVRAANGEPVAVGEVGELTLAGSMVFAGYLGSMEDPLRPEGLWTGDLAYQDAEGDIFLCGRRKDMFISGGENVFPLEIENALHNCEGVMECAVFAVPHPQWGESGVAAVVRSPDFPVSIENLQAQLRLYLAGYKLPQEVIFVRELPKSAVGKVLKEPLREAYLSQQSQRTAP